jgi:hypothetical protein
MTIRVPWYPTQAQKQGLNGAPSFSLGKRNRRSLGFARDDKGEAVTFVSGRQVRWIERNSRSLHFATLRFHGTPGQAG